MIKSFLYLILILLLFLSTNAQNQINLCPSITIYPPNFPTKPNEEITFSVNLNGYENNHDIKYIWTVSEGKIIQGQNTSIIKVRQKIDYIRATVEISGLPEDCGSMASASTVPYDPPVAFLLNEHKFFTDRNTTDDFYYPSSLDILGEQQLRAGSAIFVIQNFKKDTPAKIIKQRTERIFKNLEEYTDVKQIAIANKKGVKNLIQIWIIPKGAQYPDCVNCKIINGSNINLKKSRKTIKRRRS